MLSHWMVEAFGLPFGLPIVSKGDIFAGANWASPHTFINSTDKMSLRLIAHIVNASGSLEN